MSVCRSVCRSVAVSGGREGLVRKSLLFVGMPDIGSLDYKDPVSCVVAFVVDFPLRLDDYVDGKAVWTTVDDEEGLRKWARRNCEHFEIR